MHRMLSVLDALQSLLLIALAAAWLAGIYLNSLLNIPPLVLDGGMGGALLGLVLLVHTPRGRLVMCLLLCLLAGAWRFGGVQPINDAQAISTFISTTRVSIRGEVVDEPELQGHSRVLIVAASALRQEQRTQWLDVHGNIEVHLVGTDIEDSYGANYGDNIELQGKLQAALPHSSPGIFASMLFPHVSVIGNGGNALIGFLYHLRNRCAAIILQVLPQPEAALLIALVLGLRTPGLAPLKFAFNVTGTAHLIVPSGFKVTILAGLVAAGARWLYRIPLPGQFILRQQRRWQNWIVTVLTLLSIAAYTVLSGAGPAAIRAGTMGSLLVLAPRLGRTYNVYTALALSSVLMSAIDPFILWDTGFQLSFLGTLGIVLLTPSFQSLLRILETLPLGHMCSEMIAVTLAAQTATLPIFAITFQQISFIAPLANVLTVPLLGMFIGSGMLICLLGFISLQFALVGGWVAWPLLTYVSNCILWCASLPGAYVSVTDVSSGWAWAYYLLLASVLTLLPREQRNDQERFQAHHRTAKSGKRAWHIIQWCAAALFVCATGFAIILPQREGPLSITFLDVGPAGQPAQGEAIFIRTAENKTALIDGGSDATSLGQALDSRLASWQRSLDMVILTSPRADHLAGLQDVITRYAIGSIYDPGMLHPTTTYSRWRRNMSERNLRYSPLHTGETISVGTGVSMQVLWPQADMHKSGDEARDNSLILRLVAPGLHILFLGAAAQSNYALTGLLKQVPSDLRSAIVQVVGEKNKAFAPALRDVLQKVRPSLVIVTPGALSAAQRNAPVRVEQPQQDQALFAGMYVHQTEQTGSLEIASTATGWSMDAASG